MVPPFTIAGRGDARRDSDGPSRAKLPCGQGVFALPRAGWSRGRARTGGEGYAEPRCSGRVGARQSACRRSSASTPILCSSAGRAMPSSWNLPTNGQKGTSTPLPGRQRTSPGRRRVNPTSEIRSIEVPARYGYLHLRTEAERGGAGADALAEPRGRRGQRHHGGGAAHGRGKELFALEDDAPRGEFPSAADRPRVHLERCRVLCKLARKAGASRQTHRSVRHTDRGAGARAEADSRFEQRARVRQGLWLATGKLGAGLDQTVGERVGERAEERRSPCREVPLLQNGLLHRRCGSPGRSSARSLRTPPAPQLLPRTGPTASS